MEYIYVYMITLLFYFIIVLYMFMVLQQLGGKLGIRFDPILRTLGV